MRGNLKVDIGALANKLHDPYEKHIELGVVFKPDDGDHYTIEQTDGKNTDIYVECQLVPTQTEVTARLCCIGESGGTGIYKIPPPGTEVIIVFPGGTLDAVPYIVASGNTVSQDGPNSGKGVPDELDADTMVIANTKATIICNNNGDITINAKQGNVVINASSLVKINGDDQYIALAGLVKDQLSNIETVFNAHIHKFTGTGVVGPPDGYSYTAGNVNSGKVKAGL